MSVPLFDLTRQHAALAGELEAAFARVLRSGHYILGAEVAAFERECAGFLGVKHALGVSSGTDALLLALMALDIGPGDEVLVPAFTFFATAGCVARLGATPVFVDVDEATFNMDAADAAEKVSPRTKAIVPVHLFGQTADMDAINALAAGRRLAVIEDAAQAIGARRGGRQAGALGTCAALSFFPTKNLGALGDAGLFTTNDDALAERAAVLRVHGMKPKYRHAEIGGNFRIDALQAALLRVKLPHLPAYTAKRQANAAAYQSRLGRLPAEKIIFPADAGAPGEHAWNQFTLRVPGEGRRDALAAHLRERGIGTEIYYPWTLDEQPCFQKIGRGGESCLRARVLAREVLSIPIFPELTAAERDEVAAAIESFFAS